ncbi:MAG: hypothetical protein ACHQ49_14320 [Elusimicrobiota bacterium]
MSSGIEVKANPIDSGVPRLFGPTALMAVFGVAGLVLLYLAIRILCRRHHRPHHAERFTVHRH